PCVGDSGAIHHMGDGAMADLAIGRVLAMQERIDHRILEMGAAPPGDERVGIAAPALRVQEWRRDRHQSALHVDDRAILIEHADLDAVLDALDAHGALPLYFDVIVLIHVTKPSSASTITSLSLRPDRAGTWKE